jgi:hypothetical protein
LARKVRQFVVLRFVFVNMWQRYVNEEITVNIIINTLWFI